MSAGWLTAFALLEIGRRFNLALLSPESITEDQYGAAQERFRSAASRRQRAEYERLVTVRDGMATASVSLCLSLLVVGVDFIVDMHLRDSPWSDIRNGASAVVVLAGIGIALQLAHRAYVRRAWRYLSHERTDRGQERGGGTPAVLR